jgi:hypothetical protein
VSAGYLLLLFLGVIGMKAVFHWQVEAGAALGFGRPSAILALGALVVTCPIGLAIHECGHLLAGILCRQACRRFAIGPFEFSRLGGRWQTRLTPMRHAAVVDLVPSTFEGFRLQRAICAAGGPLLSMAGGAALLWASLHSHSAWQFWAASLAVQWTLVGVLQAAPLRTASAASDGYKVWEAFRGGAALDRVQMDLLTASSHATPLRLCDWPHDLIQRLEETPMDAVNRRYTAYLAYVHLLDRGEPNAAGERLDRLIDGWSPADPPEYALEAAWFHALHRNDGETALKWLELAKGETEPWVRLRAQAAVERRAGAVARARRMVEEALTAVQAAPACGAHEYEIDRLRSTYLA